MTDVQVLVIGGGPSGLFVATELARYGVSARVVEARTEPNRPGRATVLQPATLEILAQAGIAMAVLEASVHLPFARLRDAELAVVSEMAFAGAGSAYEFECSLPQYETERVITERLRDLAGRVERGVTATTIVPQEDAVHVTLAPAFPASWRLGAQAPRRHTPEGYKLAR